jgi:hypothetical protein
MQWLEPICASKLRYLEAKQKDQVNVKKAVADKL